MIKNISILLIFSIICLFSSTMIGSKENNGRVWWDKLEVNEYGVAIIIVTDNPESFYIVDTRADLCFFASQNQNGISIVRVPCGPFSSKVEGLEAINDRCE